MKARLGRDAKDENVNNEHGLVILVGWSIERYFYDIWFHDWHIDICMIAFQFVECFGSVG